MVRVETRLRMKALISIYCSRVIVFVGKEFFFKKTASGGLIEFGLSFFLV